MKKIFLTTLGILLAAGLIVSLFSLGNGESYIGKTRTPVLKAEPWNKAYAAYVNKGSISLFVDDAYVSGLSGSYMSDSRELMLETGVIRDAFDCAVHWYDDGRISLSKGSLTMWAQEGANSVNVDEHETEISECPVQKDGKKFIPAQALVAGLGYSYTWQADSNTGIFVSENPEIDGISSYYSLADTGKITYVRNQEDLGACWAFASVAALEYTLQPAETWDFSEDHMIWNNAYNVGADGGDYLMALSYLTSWTGPVKEEDDPYNDGGTKETLEAVKHVQEVQILPQRDFEAIKKMVFKYGVVESSIYIELSEDGTEIDRDCYSADTYSYIYNEGSDPNHEIVIIGWDDDYPAENFGGKAQKDGAFICKNSWGSEFGDNGIFYVSYEDTVIGKTAVAYTRIEDPENYDNIYQLDRAGWTGLIGYGRNKAYMANVYTAEKDENLHAAGFYASEANTSYKVYVIRDFKDADSLNIKGRVYAQGTLRNKGFYTVDLADEPQLDAGEKFAVIVEIITPGSSKPVAIELGNKNVEVELEGKESYISSYGERWEKTQDTGGGNVILKAYTKDR